MNVKEQVRELWRQCFNDSEEFINLYFSLRYSDDINTCIREEGKVVSALQRIPYTMTCFGEEIPMAYISGACTAPAYRNKGLMTQLLASAHRRMYEEGKWLSALIPAEEWLAGYYARSGYALSFQQHTELSTGMHNPVNNSEVPLEIKKIDLCKTHTKEVFNYFNEQLRSLPFCVQHTEADFRIILSDWKLGGGELWTARDGNLLKGLAFCLFHNGHLLVRELLASNENARNFLLNFCMEHYHTDHRQAKETTIISPTGENLHTYGMARIINVEHMLGLYARIHNDRLCISVEGDNAIPENNGTFVLENGHCRREPEKGEVCHTYTLPELTRWFFNGHQPYMNLMLD